MIFPPGNSSDRQGGSLLADALIALVILSLAYISVLRGFSMAITGTERQTQRIEKIFQPDKGTPYAFFEKQQEE